MKIILVVALVFGGLFFLKKRRDSAAEKAPVTMQTEQNQPEPTAIPYVQCPLRKKCHSLRVLESGCRANSSRNKCQNFVRFFKKLAVTSFCMRPGDKKPVPSVWICDEDEVEKSFPKLYERSVQTLSELNKPYAVKFYGSELFRSTLYGYLRDKYLDGSYSAEAKMTKK